MTSVGELHGISCRLMSLKSLPRQLEGIKGLAARVFSSRLGGCGCRVTPRNQPTCRGHQLNCPPELLKLEPLILNGSPQDLSVSKLESRRHSNDSHSEDFAVSCITSVSLFVTTVSGSSVLVLGRDVYFARVAVRGGRLMPLTACCTHSTALSATSRENVAVCD